MAFDLWSYIFPQSGFEPPGGVNPNPYSAPQYVDENIPIPATEPFGPPIPEGLLPSVAQPAVGAPLSLAAPGAPAPGQAPQGSLGSILEPQGASNWSQRVVQALQGVRAPAPPEAVIPKTPALPNAAPVQQNLTNVLTNAGGLGRRVPAVPLSLGRVLGGR